MAVTLAGCATPGQRIDAEAGDFGFSRREISTGAFRHVAYFNRTPGPADTLHVYLEGDGSPWIRERWIASDPTPRNPLVLRLMSLDHGASVYLGRPCYLGTAGDPACEPGLWTSARYSDAVVDSMETAVRDVMRETGAGRTVFIGHSGGGTLAMLLAGRVEETVAVVTIAGNLDTDAWTALHAYSPLTGSLNPAGQPPLRPEIRQIHLVGESDTVVPPDMVGNALGSRRDVIFRVIPGFSHVCCWEEIWPDVLQLLTGEAGGLSPGTSGGSRQPGFTQRVLANLRHPQFNAASNPDSAQYTLRTGFRSGIHGRGASHCGGWEPGPGDSGSLA